MHYPLIELFIGHAALLNWRMHHAGALLALPRALRSSPSSTSLTMSAQEPGRSPSPSSRCSPLQQLDYGMWPFAEEHLICPGARGASCIQAWLAAGSALHGLLHQEARLSII